MSWWLQLALQFSGLPVSVSMVQALPSPQSSGQLPSQISPGSRESLPQEAEQSSSRLALQPAGQQPSPGEHCVISWLVQATLQLAALPVMVSSVQSLPSLQVVGQSPSQVSPGSSTSLPQLTEQSVSLLASQPGAQQPSPSTQAVIAWWAQVTLQFSALPVMASWVQALPSLQSAGQLPSQVSPSSSMPLPQLVEQSLSELKVQPAGQQPSLSAQVSCVR